MRGVYGTHNSLLLVKIEELQMTTENHRNVEKG